MWANRLRYLAPTLLEHLNLERTAPLKRLRFQTAPLQQRQPAIARRHHRPVLSARNADVLVGAAAAVSDPALAAALRRLARHATDASD